MSYIGAGNLNIFESLFVNTSFSNDFPSFQVYNSLGIPNFYISPDSNLVQTINNILDDGSGNLSTVGNVTIGSATGAGQSIIIPTANSNTYNPSITASNSGIAGYSFLTLDSDNFVFNIDPTQSTNFNSSAGSLLAISGAGQVTTLYNTLDDSSGNANFIGQVNSSGSVQYAYKYALSGAAYDGTSGSGVALVLGHTSSDNKQVWLIDPDTISGSDDANAFQFLISSGLLGISGITSLTGSPVPLVFQNNGALTTFGGDVLFNGQDGSVNQIRASITSGPEFNPVFIFAGGEASWLFDSHTTLNFISSNPITIMPSTGIPTVPALGATIYTVIDGLTGFSVPYYQDEGGNNFAWGTGGGSGSVTEVATTDYLSVDGVPGASITTSGTLSFNLAYFDFDPGTTFNLFIGTNISTLPSGFYNTVGGFGAGASLTTGAQSTFFGYFAGNAQVSNNYTTAFGNNTLAQTTGISNNGFGSLAGYSIVGGNYNACFGDSSLGASISDNYNSTFGYHAMWVGTGGTNSIFGAQAAVAITALSDCAFFGYNTGTTMTNCTQLSLFGSGATAVDGISNSGAFGYGAIVGASNSYSYGPDGSSNHGFGTAVPQSKMHVRGGILLDATGINSYTNAGFYQAGNLNSQFIEQSSGSTPELLLQITVPNSGDANLGSALTVDVELIGVDISIGSNGSAYAKTSAQVVFDSSAVTFIGGSAPTIVFTTTGAYFTTTAVWAITGNTLSLTVTGPTGLSANWIGTYSTFATATGLSP